jgi:hypothetical protein
VIGDQEQLASLFPSFSSDFVFATDSTLPLSEDDEKKKQQQR